jgi:pyruvate kinase
MMRSGMDVARLNFSHGTHSEHARTLRRLRQAARATGKPICVVQDLQGPKIRVGDLAASSFELITGRTVTISTTARLGTSEVLSTTYPNLARDVKSGDRVLIDDGKIELRTLRTNGKNVRLRVVVGGIVRPHKGINLPGVAVSAPSLTEKDKSDLQFAFEHDIDYVALSFVRQARDLTMLREYMAKHGPTDHAIPIIAKVEKGEAIHNIDAVLHEADAVMVARGDLGVELPVEDVPLLQKMIVRKCNELGKPVIIATQMLESMIENPSPTRAEASDVANAVLDGADAVMLSGETSVGHYPLETIGVMNRIICTTEAQPGKLPNESTERLPNTHPYDPLARAACLLARNQKAAAMVAITHSGTTARRVAKFRPGVRIIGITDSDRVVRQLNLVWGVRGVRVPTLRKDTDRAFVSIDHRLRTHGLVMRGETIVVLAGVPLSYRHPTNTIKLDRV